MCADPLKVKKTNHSLLLYFDENTGFTGKSQWAKREGGTLCKQLFQYIFKVLFIDKQWFKWILLEGYQI